MHALPSVPNLPAHNPVLYRTSMSSVLIPSDRRDHGHRARKQLPRRAHADFDPKARTHDPLHLLEHSDRGRVPALVDLKRQRMSASPFGFFRGAVPVMAADLAHLPNTGIVNQICGDAHIRNLGAYAGIDGRLLFDINDFDETIRGPFEWDVKRLATSLILAAHEAHAKDSVTDEAVLAFLAHYRKSMRLFATLPITAVARYQIHRIDQVEPVAGILAKAERATPMVSLEKLTEPADSSAGKAGKPKHPKGSSEPGKSHSHASKPDKSQPEKSRSEKLKSEKSKPDQPITHEPPPSQELRRFRSEPPLLTRLTGKSAQLVLDSLTPYARTLQPERRHFLAGYRPIDVAFKVVGTGSVGLRDYCVYLEGNGPDDPIFLQIKEEAPSAYAAYLPEGATSRAHQGHRVLDGARAMQLQSDPFLGYTTVEGRDYLVRQLNDHKASLDLDADSRELRSDGLIAYADLCGELLARGHARSGDPIALSAYLGNSPRFDRAIAAFATAYANQTERDWKQLTRSLHPRKLSK